MLTVRRHLCYRCCKYTAPARRDYDQVTDKMREGASGSSVTRRELLSMIGTSAGGAAMYQAMSSLGLAADSGYKGPIQLSGAPSGA